MTIEANFHDLELLSLKQHYLTVTLQLMEKYTLIFVNQQLNDSNKNSWQFYLSIQDVVASFYDAIKKHDLTNQVLEHFNQMDEFFILMDMLASYSSSMENTYSKYKYIDPKQENEYESDLDTDNDQRVFQYDYFYGNDLIDFMRIMLNKKIAKQVFTEDRCDSMTRIMKDAINLIYSINPRIPIKMLYIEDIFQQYLPNKSAILLEAEHNIRKLIKQHNLNIDPMLFSDDLHKKYCILSSKDIISSLPVIVSIFDSRLFKLDSVNMCSLLYRMLLLIIPVTFTDAEADIFTIPQELNTEEKKAYLLKKFQGNNIEQFLTRNFTTNLMEEFRIKEVVKSLIILPICQDPNMKLIDNQKAKARKTLLEFFLICCGNQVDLFNRLFDDNNIAEVLLKGPCRIMQNNIELIRLCVGNEFLLRLIKTSPDFLENNTKMKQALIKIEESTNQSTLFKVAAKTYVKNTSRLTLDRKLNQEKVSSINRLAKIFNDLVAALSLNVGYEAPSSSENESKKDHKPDFSGQ